VAAILPRQSSGIGHIHKPATQDENKIQKSLSQSAKDARSCGKQAKDWQA
jgi:hypothetical protein